MIRNRAQEALEKEEERRQQKEEIPAGLQEAIRRTQEAIKKAFDRPEGQKGTKFKLTLSA
jgi:hypothetical protein